jgi:GDPmannose 4,6-dehydratase
MSGQKTAFITGITGQDGSYLAELLLSKGYRVVGLVSPHNNPIGEANILRFKDQLILEEGDLLDGASLNRILATHRPDEIYNLAAIAFPPQGWERPSLTFDINVLGVSRLIEGMFVSKLSATRFYQASSGSIYGQSASSSVTETTPMAPLDLYGIAKLAAHQLVGAMRREKGIFAVSGILFNHESERRGEQFVTRKITLGAARIKLGLAKDVLLGDLDAERDWGYAPDYVEAMWLMLQQDKPADFVIATGQAHRVRDVCEIAFKTLGLKYQDYVKTDPAFVRKTDVRAMVGDATQAKNVLGWQPKTSFETMIQRMVEHDSKSLAKETHA